MDEVHLFHDSTVSLSLHRQLHKSAVETRQIQQRSAVVGLWQEGLRVTIGRKWDAALVQVIELI